MREGDWDQAVVLFEDAYANGFDIAELHAHLAFARYRASDNDPETAQAALDLLDYAESIDPGLPILHAYRGAVLVAVGREDEAVECFDRALYLDPNNELALAYRRDE
jgi:tetratricopeptide (TPR) repeat protein